MDYADETRAQLTNETYTIKCGIDSTNRAAFLEDVVAKIVSDKPAIIYVYTPDGDFQFPNINADQWTQNYEKETYFIAASERWNGTDLKECASLMEFELGALWIQLVTEINRDQVDSVKFFEAIDRICLGRREPHPYECIGLVADGQEFIWDNPNIAEVMKLQPDIKQIAQEYEIDLNFVDKRT